MINFSAIIILIQRIINHLRRQPPIRFILFVVCYNLAIDILVIPFLVMFAALGVDYVSSNLSSAEFFIIAIILAPIIETLLGQMLPILIARRFTKSSLIIIIISALVFALPHCTKNVTKFLPAFPAGIIYAFTFLHWLEKSKTKAYWITCAAHCLYNLILTSPIIFLRSLVI